MADWSDVEEKKRTESAATSIRWALCGVLMPNQVMELKPPAGREGPLPHRPICQEGSILILSVVDLPLDIKGSRGGFFETSISLRSLGGGVITLKGERRGTLRRGNEKEGMRVSLLGPEEGCQ